MAAPNTLQVGDRVTHADWPEGTSRTVVRFSLFQRLGWRGKRRVLVDSPNVRIVYLDAPVHDPGIGEENAWMEAGLVPINNQDGGDH